MARISAPFRYSGQSCYRVERDNECARFERDTGITLEANRGIDTSTHAGGWRGVRPLVEIVTCDFTDLPAANQTRPEGVECEQLALLTI